MLYEDNSYKTNVTGAEISEGTSMSPTIVADGNADGKASADRIFVEDSGGHEDLPTEIAVPNEEWENLLQQDKKRSGEESKKKGKT